MRPKSYKLVLLSAALASAAGIGLLAQAAKQTQGETVKATHNAYRSPLFLAVSTDGTTVYASDQTGGVVSVLDAAGEKGPKDIDVNGHPRGLCLSADGSRLFVAEHGASTVAVIDTAQAKVTGRIQVGLWPTAVAISPKNDRLYVGNQDRHSISVIDLSEGLGKQIKEVPVVREPSCVAVTPDGSRVIVANLLPLGPGIEPTLSAHVDIIDSQTLTCAASVKLPPGSSVVHGLCVSPDGKWAYVVHGLGRFNLPITQLERGWVNTFALTVIDIARGECLVTSLLDDLTQGAADPFSVVCSADGSKLWISHAGVHEISMIDIARVHELLQGKVPENLAALQDGTQPNIWVRIQQDRELIAELANDLTALYIAEAIRRVPSGGNGPRGLALSADGKRLFVANYYAGSVAVLDAAEGKPLADLPLGPQSEPDSARRGEIIFHDATHAFQRWHSCASCHPNEGRTDGLRWDFLGDGIGNAKDTISLLMFHKTEPLNRRATVDKALACTKNGLAGTNMLVPTEQEVEDLYAYLTSLRPVPSPQLTPEGKLTEAAQRGKALFEGKASCSGCHPAPYFTDNKMHNVGVLSSNEPDGRYDTPSLLETYRTAPYLHDGRAVQLKEVFTVHDEQGKHGKADKLTEKELDDLLAYLLSL